MKIDYNRTLMNHMGVYLDKPAAKSQDVFLECIEMIEKKKNIKEFDNSKKSIRKILKYYGEVRSNPESENDKKYTILKLFRFQHPSEETYYIFVLVIAREYTYLIKLVRNEKKIDNVTLINEIEAFEDIEICEESAEIKKNDSYGTVGYDRAA